MGVSRHGLDIGPCYGSGWVTRSDRPRGVELPPLGARVPITLDYMFDSQIRNSFFHVITLDYDPCLTPKLGI